MREPSLRQVILHVIKKFLIKLEHLVTIANMLVELFNFGHLLVNLFSCGAKVNTVVSQSLFIAESFFVNISAIFLKTLQLLFFLSLDGLVCIVGPALHSKQLMEG